MTSSSTRSISKLVLALAFAILLPALASAQVVFDANGTAGASSAGVTSYNYTGLTVGSGSNRCMVAQIVWEVSTVTVGTVTWNGVAMESIANVRTSGANGRVALYGLVNPASGNQTLALGTWTTASQVIVNATSWTGCNQTGSTTTWTNAVTGTGTTPTNSPTVTITCSANKATVAAMTDDGADPNTPAATNSTVTQTFLDTIHNIPAAGSRTSSITGNVAQSWTLGGTSNWAEAGVCIAEAAGGATSNPNNPFQTVRSGLEWLLRRH